MNRCPSQAALQQWLADPRNVSEAEVIAFHVEWCAICQDSLEELTRMSWRPQRQPPAVSPSSWNGSARAPIAFTGGEESGATFLDRLKKAPPTNSSHFAAATTKNPCHQSAGGSAAAPSADDPPRIAGYVIREQLRRGGMGVVYLAEQRKLKRQVALKVMRGDARRDPVGAARFRREAEITAALQHPHIVEIFDFGESQGRPYCVLEWVRGSSLDIALAGAVMPAVQAAQLVATLARTIHFAHQNGIIHCDLKPANILLADVSGSWVRSADDKGQSDHLLPCDSVACSLVPKIADFGLALNLGDSGRPRASGNVAGTLGYMAPEQAAGLTWEIGPPTDVHGLGAVLYEILTGICPFPGPSGPTGACVSSHSVHKQVVTQAPVPPRRLRPMISTALEAICLKCLHKQPHHRYASAKQLAEDLNRAQQEKQV